MRECEIGNMVAQLVRKFKIQPLVFHFGAINPNLMRLYFPICEMEITVVYLLSEFLGDKNENM